MVRDPWRQRTVPLRLILSTAESDRYASAMEGTDATTARAELERLSLKRQVALERMVMPWRYVIGWSVVMNGCMLAVVLPIVLSMGWTLLIQAVFLGAAIALFRRQQPLGVERAEYRVEGEWLLNALCVIGGGGALALGILARSQESALLGGAALLVNAAALLVAYGGHGFLIRRQLARLP